MPRQKSQRTLNREASDRAMREHPVATVILFALLIVLILALPTCSQMLKWMDL
jgi:hypothetical protein